jgi:hypothetical protein
MTPNDLEPKNQVALTIVLAEMTAIGFFGHLLSLLSTVKGLTWGKFGRALILSLRTAFLVLVVGFFLAESEIQLYWKLGLAGLLSMLSAPQLIDIIMKIATKITELPIASSKGIERNPLDDEDPQISTEATVEGTVEESPDE